MVLEPSGSDPKDGKDTAKGGSEMRRESSKIGAVLGTRDDLSLPYIQAAFRLLPFFLLCAIPIDLSSSRNKRLSNLQHRHLHQHLN